MSHKKHLQDAHRRNMRWYILSLADAGRVVGVSETTALRALTDAKLTPTPSEIREEATYLERRGLIKIDETGPEWGFTITADGMDIVSYDEDCPSSIGRPEKHWD
ncbi:MAG: hypothetical protein JKX72_02350 [Robiginitomaculum sp.]|nr:hypothetical protein [Robiginitomaculum sp.]